MFPLAVLSFRPTDLHLHPQGWYRQGVIDEGSINDMDKTINLEVNIGGLAPDLDRNAERRFQNTNTTTKSQSGRT